MAEQNFHKAHYAAEKLGQIKGIEQKFSGPFFNEFVIELPIDWPSVDRALEEKGIIPGLGLEESFPELRNCTLLCTTEKHNKEDIDRLASALEDVLEK
jgi:glycine dehydrogenase subunit 1